MRTFLNDRYFIRFEATEYHDILDQINSPEGFKFRINFPMYKDTDQWKTSSMTTSIVSRSENPRRGLYSLQVYADSLRGEPMLAVWTFTFVGVPDVDASPRFELLGGPNPFAGDWCTTASAREFNDFIRDHEDSFVSVMAGCREHLAKFKRKLRLPAHNPNIKYACRLTVPEIDREIDVFFYKH